MHGLLRRSRILIPHFHSATMTTQAVQQPPWTAPPGVTKHPKLKVYNSLTRSKVPFRTQDPSGQTITWYSCGPTVYDEAHIGHGRNYVSIDILRRILRDYFNFKIDFIMNITDVDDKIILRGRQQHLLEQYRASHPKVNESVLSDVSNAYAAYVKKNLPLVDEVGLPSPEHFREALQTTYGKVLRGESLEGDGKPGDKEAKIKMHINTVQAATDALVETDSTANLFYSAVSDIMAPYLDAKEGPSIDASNYGIWAKLTQEYEHRFFRDMKDLNVLEPDSITRVTEYGQEIADFVEKIVANKFGYAADGSVYFDIEAFEKSGYPYARLEPWNRNDKDLQADGEGALTQKTSHKKSEADFALWKASKPGEPSWQSPWGKGRPGWHIECSAMASAKLGHQMDIHSGGIDLAFPHHDNELAQSEAYWHDNKKEQWVNYFLHMGHLSIQGAKMSKSLKNFTTIRKALDRGDWTPRSLRIVFLLGSWRNGIEITDGLVSEGDAWEDKVNNFFLKVLNFRNKSDRSAKNGPSGLREALSSTEAAVYDALCDSFNTPAVLKELSDLITKFNSTDIRLHDPEDIKAVGLYITKIVNIFGLNGDASPNPTQIGWSGIDIPEEAKPSIYALSELRDNLREAARSKHGITGEGVSTILSKYNPSTINDGSTKDSEAYANVLESFRSSAAHAVELAGGPDSTNLSKDILTLCDRVRDLDLWNLSIYLEDSIEAGEPALVRPVTKELLAARQEREQKAKEKQVAKEKREREAREKEDKGRLDPKEMFKLDGVKEEFSEWDAEGMPTKDKEGKDLAKSRVKKLRKDWERQKKAHDSWLAVNRTP